MTGGIRIGRDSFIVLTLVSAVVLAGCGGGSDSNASDPAMPRAVAVAWSRALTSGDGKTACSLMTPASVREVEKPLKRIPALPIGGHAIPGKPARPCAVVMSRGSGPTLPPASTRVEGRRALVQMRDRKQIMHRVVLFNIHGDWRVDFARTFGHPFGTD